MIIYTEETIAQAIDAEFAPPASVDMQSLDMAMPTPSTPDKTALDETVPDEVRDETSIAQFCEFVDYFTRHVKTPLSLALVCAQQAETLRLRERDATPETIRMVIDTMLDAIEHLEQKWLDEQIQCEDLQQAYARQLAYLSARPEERESAKSRRHSWHQRFARLSSWFGFGKRVPRHVEALG